MTQDATIAGYAEALVAENMQRLDPILRFYDDGVRADVSEEQRSLVQRAKQLDHALRNLLLRCAEAHESKSLVLEMRKLRVRGLQFFLFLRASHRQLKTITRRLRAQVRIDGYEAEMNLLKIELSMSEVDSQFFEVDELFRNSEGQYPRKQPPFSRVNEIRLFLQACLLPLKSREDKRPHEIVARTYAQAIARLISSSTREIYKQQSYSLAVVLWRVVQPTILALIVGGSAALLSEAARDLAGIKLLHPTIWGCLAFVLGFASEKAVEHLFDHWHLVRYRKGCADTALRLYLTEIRARGCLLGLVRLSEATPLRSDPETSS